MPEIEDYYAGRAALNTDTGEIQKDAPIEVYAGDDNAFTTRLRVYDAHTNVEITDFRSSPIGSLPDFYPEGRLPQILIKSGTFVSKLTSEFGFLLHFFPGLGDVPDGFTFVWNSGAFQAVPPPGADIRSDVEILTSTLAVYATQTGLVTMRPSYALISVTVDRPCRLRLYDSPAHRDADVSRPRGTDPDPTSNVGLMCDIAFPGPGTRTMSPSVFGAVVPYGPDVPYTVDNLDASGPAQVRLTLTYLRIEQ